MTKYSIYKGTLRIPNIGDTYFWNEKDTEWLDNGGIPKKNKEGYLIMPYGNRHGREAYPELFMK